MRLVGPGCRIAALALVATVFSGCAAPGPATPPPATPSAAATASAAPSEGNAASVAPPSASVARSPDASAGADRPDLAAAKVSVQPFVDGLDQPLFVTTAGDGSGRLFVLEQPGRIRVVTNGQLSATPFLDITDRVTSGGERGLLGLAFPPGFGPDRPFVFVHYSGADGATTISRFGLDAHDPSVLDPTTEQVVLTQAQPYPNHNGGWIGFDPDGMLLIALGDGGSGGDPQNRASNLDVLLGKMLRIDVLNPPAGKTYGIPSDNPFVGRADARPEVLHYGLRNPFRDSIDEATGNLWIGDVGQNSWEEVDVAPRGARGLDFGWRRWEGRHCYDPSSGCDPAGVTLPVAEYGHGAGCSVIGGVVYHGAAIPALRGAYLYSDYCSGTLWAIDAGATGPQQPVVLAQTGEAVSSIGMDKDGEVLLTAISTGRVLRLVAGS
jgi:glucose/arabinose dehydrogenase